MINGDQNAPPTLLNWEEVDRRGSLLIMEAECYDSGAHNHYRLESTLTGWRLEAIVSAMIYTMNGDTDLSIGMQRADELEVQSWDP